MRPSILIGIFVDSQAIAGDIHQSPQYCTGLEVNYTMATFENNNCPDNGFRPVFAGGFGVNRDVMDLYLAYLRGLNYLNIDQGCY